MSRSQLASLVAAGGIYNKLLVPALDVLIIDLSPKWPPRKFKMIKIKLSGKSIPAPERPPLVW